MDKHRLIELLAKRESGVITLPEIRELNGYLKSNPADQQTADLLKQVLKGNFEQQQAYAPANIRERLQKLHSKLDDRATANPVEEYPEPQRRPVFRLFIRSIAAILIIVLGVGAFYYYLNEKENIPAPQNILATKKGSKSSLVLPDGTKVQLNGDTKLVYDQSFGKKLREVTLEGEAYFEVVKDSEHPFIVHTKTLNVKVLGTVFNVRAYNSEKNTQATLLRGSVEVTLNKRKEKNLVVLKPNEKIIVKNADESNEPEKKQIADISIIDVKTNIEEFSAPETEWTKNRLVFDQDHYSEVFPELERWYGVTVIVKDSAILKRKVSGIYDNESLMEVLESLKLATGFRYKIDGNDLIIY
ncbi:MAG: FecR domain-containing protein [Niabella sp.]